MAIWQSVVHMTHMDQQERHVYHIGQEASGDLSLAQDTMENLIENGYYSLLRPILSDDWNFTGLVTFQNVSTPGQPIIPVLLDSFSGQSPANNLPPQVAALVTWRADTPRPNKAHKYIGGWTTTNLNANARINGAIVTVLETFANVVINSQPLGGFMPFLTVKFYPDRKEVWQANQLTRAVVPDIFTDRSTRKIGRGI